MFTLENSSFKRLVGTWRTTGVVFMGGNKSRLEGTDTYELILNQKFILHKANVKMGNEPSETHELIAIDANDGTAVMQYFNSKGERGTMRGRISGNDFQMDGVGIKFKGMISDDNSGLTGKWYLQEEGSGWVEFIDLKLQREPLTVRQE